MKFGWMTLSMSPSPADDLASVHQQLEQGVLAEAMGFDYLWLTEHNFTGECSYADPIPFAGALAARTSRARSEEHTSELQSQSNLVCRLLLEKKKKKNNKTNTPN